MSCQRNVLLLSRLIIFSLVCSKSICQPWVHLKTDSTEPNWDILKLPNQSYLNPKPEDRAQEKLEEKLGRKLDPRFMSDTPPWGKNKPQNGYIDDEDMTDNFSRTELVHSMPRELRKLDFRMPGLGKSLGLRASRKLRLWLWKLSYCPLLERWEDFGERIWPRFINRGSCTQKSCSFPSGMKCKESRRTSLPVLLWYCRDKSSRQSCSWFNTHIGVLTECKCSC